MKNQPSLLDLGRFSEPALLVLISLAEGPKHGYAMAQDIQRYLEGRMAEWRASRPGVEALRVAVMGCVVNGPGESKHADLGISLPGTAEDPKAPVYMDGALHTTLKGEAIVPEFLAILDAYVARRYPVLR